MLSFGFGGCGEGGFIISLVALPHDSSFPLFLKLGCLDLIGMMLSPASLTLKFDAIIDVPEGDEALSDSALPLLFRPLSPRAVITSPGMPRSYSYYPPPAVEEIVVGSPSGSSPTLVASPATPGHRASARARGSPRSVRFFSFSDL